MVVERKGQTSVCEQRTCGYFSGLGHSTETVGSSAGQETAKHISTADNLQLYSFPCLD